MHRAMKLETLDIELMNYTFCKKGDDYILSLANHCEIVSTLSEFCEAEGLEAAEISGLGAVSEATLRFLDPATKAYVDKTFAEQMEIANLTGNLSRKDGKVYLHIHLSLGRRDYTMVGGHALCATINGACELFVRVIRGAQPQREFDPQTGLNLYKF